MRPSLMLQKSRRVQLAAGALTLIVPTTAIALTEGPTNASAVPQTAPQFKLSRHHIGYGDRISVTGAAAQATPGTPLALEYAPGVHGARWRTIANAPVRNGGRFRRNAVLLRSGRLRVSGRGTATATRNASAPVAAPAPAPTSPVVTSSPSQTVRVRARLRVHAHAINKLDGQSIAVPGHLLPGVAGRVVHLDARFGRHWRSIATAHTGARGGFKLRYRTANTGRRGLRVRFVGDRTNTRVGGGAGTLTVYRQSVASWYYDAGSTACGFHATYGVANKYLPCGTHVTFRHGGQTVTATVDDRGPFVAGREWDLSQSTAGALHFGGVGTVWSSK
jgi:rare lipoprotein A